MKYLKAFLLILFYSILPFIGLAQYNQPLKDYTIKVWSDKDGLPSNNLSYVVQDYRGYLWVSTFDGAVRFDGNEFKIFDTKNIDQLTTSAFRSILPLPDSSMYFSTQSSGLLYYNNGKFSNPYKDGILPKNIMLTFKDNKGRIWIGCEFAGLYYMQNDKIIKYDLPEFNNVTINDIIIDSENSLWVASDGGGLAKITDSGYQIFNAQANNLPSNYIKSLIAANNRIYIGTSDGLAFYQKGVIKIDNRIKKRPVFDIDKDSNNSLWLATAIGLARIDSLNNYEFISVEDGLPERSINSVEVDANNNIWLATYRGGLVLLKPSIIKNITTKDGLSYHSINIISETPDGEIYIGNNDAGIDILKGDSINAFRTNTVLEYIPIKDILIEDDGTMWIGAYNKLIKKSGATETVYTNKNGLLSNQMRHVIKAKNGSIWVATRNGGINIINKDGSIKSISPKDGLGSDFVLSIDEASNGNMVLGTANGGLNIIKPNFDIEIVYPDTSLTSMTIFNVYIEHENRMWLATNVGLYCYVDKQFYLINPSNGLAVETIFDVAEDRKENLWMTSVMGVVKISKKEVLQLIDGKISKIKSTLLDDSDGMVTRECTPATRLLVAQDGCIYVPTIKGVVIIDPKKRIVEADKQVYAYIEDVIIDDEDIDKYSGGHLNTGITIEPGHRNYRVKFTTLNLSSADKIKFKYMLSGFDEDWIEAGSERQAKYTNLPYGDYTFKVLAANNNGVWSTDYASINIRIEPYFYKTKWFIILLILIFIVFTYLIYAYQTKEVNERNTQLVKLNKELDSFSYSVSHDLKAPLASIQGLLNIARLEEGKDALDYYNRIESSVDKLNSFIKDIMDYSKNARMGLKKETFSIKELITNMVDGISDENEGKKIKFTLDVPDDLQITADKTRFTFIVNNLLSNAFRYADLGKENPWVSVIVKMDENKFYLTVEDNGQGIKEEYQNKVFNMFYRANEFKSGSGLGLYIVKESLEKIGGSVWLQSELRVGTKIKIIIPV